MVGFFRLAVAAAGFLAAFASIASAESPLERIKATGEIRLAYRADASPFSYVEGDKPMGYSVELCRRVAQALQTELKLPSLTATFVPVTAANRFDAITSGQADLLCEATSATLSRRKTMDFSIYTFVSGASLAIRPDGPQSFEAVAGKRIAVLGGTTTQEDLDLTMKEQNVSAEVVVVKSHDEGFDLLKAGEIGAYFADRTILQEHLRTDADAKDILLAENYLTIEPYALAMPIDHDFRLAVDIVLSRLFRSGGIIKVFRTTFPQEAKPSDLLKALSRISGLPE
jgi:ABC-type amino acid transport substrate-binding protein